MEVANHFMRNGTNPIMTLLDCSKAFDMCCFSTLFNKILEKGMPAVVVRTLIFNSLRAAVCLGKVGKGKVGNLSHC